MGSRFILDSYRDLGWLEEGLVVPYGIEPPEPAAPRPPAAKPVRFATLGSVMPHKGVHVAVAAFRGVPAGAATLDVWGDERLRPDYASELRALATPAVRFRGPFDETQRPVVFAGTDVLLAPSLGLESFGLAVREAQARGVPVVASRRGALAEAIAPGVDGELFEPGDADALAAIVRRLCERPQTIDEWRRALPAVKTMEAHAREIDEVYARVLERGRR
jgi:glycosyltransferase involved in cell wall biosynthesis